MSTKELLLVREALTAAHATWHMCRLRKDEGKMKAGRPCDDCLAEVKRAVNEIVNLSALS